MTTFKFQLGNAVAAITTLILLSAPPARSQTADDFLHSLINQKLILRNVGDQQEVRLKRSRLQDPPGSCDIAVVVEAVAWDRGTVRFQLEDVGHPSVVGSQTGQKRYCRMVYTNTLLEISGFARDEPRDSLRAAISQILLTPEQYLSAHGIPFDLSSGSEDEAVVKAPPPVRAAQPLLTVDPTFSEEARQLKYQGTLKMRLVVGTDGRAHKLQLINPLGKGLDEMAAKVLPMWRFEPARQQDKPVATEITVEVSFNLY